MSFYCGMGHQTFEVGCEMCSTKDDLRIPLAASGSICPAHTHQTGKPFDPDCGTCGSRQEACGLYLLGLVDDLAASFKVAL